MKIFRFPLINLDYKEPLYLSIFLGILYFIFWATFQSATSPLAAALGWLGQPIMFVIFVFIVLLIWQWFRSNRRIL